MTIPEDDPGVKAYNDHVKNERRVRWVMVVVAAVVTGMFGFFVGDALTRPSPREDMTPIVQNVHNFIRRDIFLANEMTPDWDVVKAVDTQNDTLIIRFSAIDSVRYYRKMDATLWREDVMLLKNVWSWRARLLPDSTSYEVFIGLGDFDNPISYEWIIIPRVQTP